MAGKPDKERMGQDMKYVIDSKVYENHINDEVHLYGLLHQLAFLAEKAKDEKDLENLAETAKRYGETAEEKFAAWRIPGRYLVFGDKADLSQLKALELYELASSMWTVRMTRTSPMPDRFTRVSFFFRHRRIGASGRI